jgi:uncharacterized integral membrane protein (TIGR00698 family)
MTSRNEGLVTAAWLAGAVIFALLSTSPAVALLAAAAISLTAGNPVRAVTARTAKLSLQGAVVLLGFGLQPSVLLHVGGASIGVTFVTIVGTLMLGLLLGRMFRIERDLSVLLSSGTAICGGSAIAAVAPAIGASHTHTAAALAVVFVLNAVALLVFPIIGETLDMSQEAFGFWAALAIHDTSSVVGATAVFGTQALLIGTTVKLTRALWIFPLAFFAARRYASKSRAAFPWFLVAFVLAALARGYIPVGEALFIQFAEAGKHVMVGTLFLIGAGLTRDDMRRIGFRPLAAAIVLWLLVSVLTLLAIQSGMIEFGGM